MQAVWYMAHPVGAPDRAGIELNLERAAMWLAFLMEAEPDAVITAPWLGPLIARVQDDANPAHRARGMRDNLVIAGRCDGIVLVGGRVTFGMHDELEAVVGNGGRVSLLTSYGRLPPGPERPLVPGLLLRSGEAHWRRVRGTREWRALCS